MFGSVTHVFYIAAGIVVMVALIVARRVNEVRLEMNRPTEDDRMWATAARRIMKMTLIGAVLVVMFLLLVAKPAVAP